MQLAKLLFLIQQVQWKWKITRKCRLVHSSTFLFVSLHFRLKTIQKNCEKKAKNHRCSQQVWKNIRRRNNWKREWRQTFLQWIVSILLNWLYCQCLRNKKRVRVLDRNTENMISISFRKHRDEKKENTLLTLIIKI